MFNWRFLICCIAVPLCAEAQIVGESKETWKLSATPSVAIGAVDREGPDVFGRVVGVVRTGDGHIAVADGFSREVRLFTSSGQYVATAGRAGEGPGEFRTLRPPMRCAADSIFVWDPSQQRVSVFNSAGVFARSFQDASLRGVHSESPGWKMSCNIHGMVAMTTRNLGDLRPTGEGPVEIAMAVQLSSLRSETTVDLGSVPGDEFYFAQGTLAPRPLGRMTLLAVGSNRVYMATGEGASIEVFAFSGDRLKAIETDVAPVPLNGRRVKAFVEEAVSASRNGERARPFYEDLVYPDKMPAYAAMLVDADDNLWLERYPMPGDHSVAKWRVYDPQGKLRALIEMPDGFEVFDIGSHYVLGVWRDSQGVDFVRMYELSKTGVK